MFVAFAVLLGLFTFTIARLHMRDVRRSLGTRAAEVLREVQRAPKEARLEKLSARAEPGTFEAKLAGALEGVTHPQAQVAATNETLSDLAHVLESRATWSPAAVRVAFFGAFLLVVLAWGRGAAIQMWVVVGCGAFSVAAAQIVRSRTRRLELERRDIANALVRTLLPDAPKAGTKASRRHG